jgi:serine/threonine protein phosphatase PrpC
MIESAGLSDVGRRRQVNEDSYLIDESSGLFVLADGMGGHAAGEVASSLAVSTVNEFVTLALEPHEMTWPFGFNVQIPYEDNTLRTATLLANLRISQSARQKSQHAGMGSTVLVVWARSENVSYTHVGDSRLYLARNGEFTQLTEDHTLVQEQIKQGLITPEEARVHRFRHVVTKALGSRGRLEVEVNQLLAVPGDTLLMCSDGVTDKVSDTDLCRYLSASPDLKIACREIIAAANDAGGEDNSTVVLVRFK